MPKASFMVVLGVDRDKSFWLGMVINVSTQSFKEPIPSRAFFILRRPSKAKGLVTIPTVNIPNSLAI